jgi:serine/threonine protein kinase
MSKFISFQFEFENSLFNNYKLIGKIGEGSFGDVYKAIHIHTNLVVALKRMPKDHCNSEEKKNQIMNEVNILKSLHHPFIAEFFDMFETDHHYFIVMEYCPNGSLHDLIQICNKLDEKSAMPIFHQLISVLEYLHLTKYIVHRDLKSQNITFDQ